MEKKFNHFENHELVKLVEENIIAFWKLDTYNFKTQN